MQLQFGTIFNDNTLLSDDDLGHSLVTMVRKAVHQNRAPTVAAIARPQQIDLLHLSPLARTGIALQPLLARITRAEIHPPVGDPLALGVMGKVLWGTPDNPQKVPMALVFLEWQDCRWWMWRALIDPADGTLQSHTETITQATNGDPMPSGLGRWWSLGRRIPDRMVLTKAPTELVH